MTPDTADVPKPKQGHVPSSATAAAVLGADVLGADVLGADVLGADVLGADVLGADVMGSESIEMIGLLVIAGRHGRT